MPAYTAYHPRWLPHPHFHLLVAAASWSYFAFILRELSSLFVAWFVVYAAPARSAP